MATFQLDDLLKDDKKDANLIPDLSKATCNSQEEFRRLMECVPEFKIRPDKPRKDEMKVRDKDFSFKTTKRELRALAKEWSYGNPIPPDMRELNLQELQQVPIDWRMLTPIRPKLRQDEELFSRLVEMGKLQLRTQARERRSRGPELVRRVKNRAGIIETSVKICGDCGEEYCTGEYCGDVLFENYERVNVPTTSGKSKQPTADAAAIIAGMDAGGKGKKKKGKKRTVAPKAAGKKKKKKKKAATNGKTARLLVCKKKTSINGSRSSLRRESEEPKDAGAKRKFRRKCSKYPANKKKNAN